MRGLRSDPSAPFAPLPSSTRKTRIALGSWFQERPRLIQAAAGIAILAGVFYFSYRLVVTSVGIAPLAFYPLFFAELFGFATFTLLAYEAWRIDPTPRPLPLDKACDVVITTYDEDIDIVEPTIVGAKLLKGNTTIYLSDDGNRPEMRRLANHYGLTYHTRLDNSGAKAGNINAVLPRLTGDLLLVLDADHVPSPDFLEATSGYFREKNLALVQTAHSFRNHNSVMHDEEGRHEQSLFFDVLLPGRNRLGSVFWCGSAALIRRSALEAIGGMSTRSVTEDFETSLELQRRGFTTRYHNEHLIQGLAPDNIKAYLIQRFRWAQGTLSAFRPGISLPWSKGITLKQKASYLGALLYYITPIQRLVYSANFIAVGVVGFIPMTYSGPVHLAAWVGWIALSLLAITALERGTSQPFEGTRNTMLSMGVFLRALPALFSSKTFAFQVTPKNQTDAGGVGAVKLVRLPIVLAGIAAIILAIRWSEWFLGHTAGLSLLPAIRTEVLVVITVFGLFEVLIVSGFARALWARRQDRVLWRFPVQLPAHVNGVPALCVDLHQAGAAFHVPRAALSDADGAGIPIALETKRLDGSIYLADGFFEVRNIRPVADSPGLVRAGGILRWLTPRDRTAVIEHCYVIEPFRARNTHWMRTSPRASVDLEGTLADNEARIIDLSIGGAAVITNADGNLAVGQDYLLTVPISHGREIRAPFTVKNITRLDDGMIRVGGSAAWPETGWLAEFLNLSFVPAKRVTPLFVASPVW
jgi:cellulose synthase (UDP-forming)